MGCRAAPRGVRKSILFYVPALPNKSWWSVFVWGEGSCWPSTHSWSNLDKTRRHAWAQPWDVVQRPGQGLLHVGVGAGVESTLSLAGLQVLRPKPFGIMGGSWPSSLAVLASLLFLQSASFFHLVQWEVILLPDPPSLTLKLGHVWAERGWICNHTWW